MCDANNVDYFEDVFAMMKENLSKLNTENAESENVGNYLKRLIEQLKNPNEKIREHVAQLVFLCKNIVANWCIKPNDIEHLSLILIASNDVYRQTENNLHELTEELGIFVNSEVSILDFIT